MKIKDNYVLQEIVDESIVVPVGDEADKLHGIIKLNSTGAFLWKALSQEQTVDSLTDMLLKEYATNREAAKADVEKFLTTLREIGCIEG